MDNYTFYTYSHGGLKKSWNEFTRIFECCGKLVKLVCPLCRLSPWCKTYYHRAHRSICSLHYKFNIIHDNSYSIGLCSMDVNWPWTYIGETIPSAVPAQANLWKVCRLCDDLSQLTYPPQYQPYTVLTQALTPLPSYLIHFVHRKSYSIWTYYVIIIIVYIKHTTCVNVWPSAVVQFVGLP